MPTAPDDRERTLYVRPANRLLIVSQAVGWTGLSAALTLFALNSPWLWPFLIWVALGVVYFGLSFLANTSLAPFDLAVHDQMGQRWSRRARPSVDVFLPNCGEPLFRTPSATSLRWRPDGPLRVLCLDDAGRTEVRALAESQGLEYLSRSNRGSSGRPATCVTATCTPKARGCNCWPRRWFCDGWGPRSTCRWVAAQSRPPGGRRSSCR